MLTISAIQCGSENSVSASPLYLVILAVLCVRLCEIWIWSILISFSLASHLMYFSIMSYKPLYTITSEILRVSAEISELVGEYSLIAQKALTPQLRRKNRIKTVQASCEIENNTLTLNQVTAVFEGKRVIGLPREIQEVRNAFKAYEGLDTWTPWSKSDFLEAHKLLTENLIDESGIFRSTGVGIYQDKNLIHMPPPAERVPYLISELQQWLKNTADHPIIASTVFHYECEFIHPFQDGNGRLGRLWQTLILSKWNAVWAYLPVETQVRDNQKEYYSVLGESDKSGEATPFITFMVQLLKKSLVQALENPQHERDSATSKGTKMALSRHQDKLLNFCKIERTIKEMMTHINRKDRTKFRNSILNPLLKSGLLKMTIPDKPKSPLQKYIATDK